MARRKSSSLSPATMPSVWDHLDGTESAPFYVSSETKIAVKVIDARGNELMVVKAIGQAILSQ